MTRNTRTLAALAGVVVVMVGASFAAVPFYNWFCRVTGYGGETGLAFYEAYNPTDRVVAGTASYNVTPYSAGAYFIKIDCFCFELQVLQPGERVRMPVTYYVDPGIVDDREAKFAHTVTLSYTFYETELPEADVSAYETNQETQVN